MRGRHLLEREGGARGTVCVREARGPRGRGWPRVIEHPAYFYWIFAKDMSSAISRLTWRVRVGGKETKSKENDHEEQRCSELRMRAAKYNEVCTPRVCGRG